MDAVINTNTHKESVLFSGLFFLSTFAVILSGLIPSLNWLNWIFKPLLMPLLAMAFFAFSHFTLFKKVLLAILFSWLGDVFLMFQQQNELFFMLGLGAFLIAHLCYIWAFLKTENKAVNVFKQKPWLFLILIAYEIGFLFLLFPNLGELLIPVVVYATVICAMLGFSILRYDRVNTPSFWMVLGGAALFVLSDSTIAINKFLMPFSLAYPAIIFTYCMGQYFIVKGITLQLME